MSVKGDRLSRLPDDLIHKILYFVSIKLAVQTSVLSSRWRYIWKSMPCLNFSCNDFYTLPKYSKFVKHVLSGRNYEIDVSSMELTFRGKVSEALVENILKYALSHNVQQLNVTLLYGKKVKFPFFQFRSQSIKHLTLTTQSTYIHSIKFTPNWDLPALTTLSIHCVTLPNENTDKGAGLFSNCANLKNLTLKNCCMTGLDGLNICHPGLTCLTIEGGYKGVNVVTPQLKNLTITHGLGTHLISAPNLSFLRYTHHNYYSYKDEDDDPLQFSLDLLHLEKVNICIHYTSEEKAYARKIVSLLQQLHSVKFLTLNLELVKLLSSSLELISHLPSPFANLKSLKIYPANLDQPNVSMSTEVKNFLLDSSQGAILTIVSHEEIRAVMNATSARNLMRELQVLLDQWKEKSGINKPHIKRDKAPVLSHMATTHAQEEVKNHRAQLDTKMRSHFEEKMAHIESYWEDLNEQLEKGYNNTRRTISLLRKIKGLLLNVPSSEQAKLQAKFSVLRAEAETIMDNVMGRVKIQCSDKKPSHSTVLP